MKKFIGLFILVTALFYVLFTSSAFASSREITVLVDGLPVSFDVPPIIRDGRTLVPFRFIAEALNVNVEWHGETRTVTAESGEISISLQIDNRTAYVNNTAVTLDTPPLLVDGRTLIPARFFAEAVNCQVDWLQDTWTVLIKSAPKPMEVLGFYALGDAQTSSWKDLFGSPFPVLARGNTDLVSTLALGWYTLDNDGNLLTRSTRTAWQRPLGWENVIAAAHSYSLTTEMTVHETNRDGLILSVLGNPEASLRLATQIADESRRYKGVNLDLEGLGLSEKGEALLAVRQSFTSFVTMLAAELRPAGKTLTLTLHPPNSVYQGYDYKALAEVADLIVIMAYDYGTKPEPVKPVLTAVSRALGDVPASKIMLGISLHSENTESILVKIGIAKRFGLRGIALWRLGLAGEKMWESIRSTVSPR